MARGRKRNPETGPSPIERRKQTFEAIAAAYSDSEDIVSQLFQGAVALEEEKRELLKRTAANRRSLRDLAAQNLASQEDVDAIYPPKGDGATDEAANDEPVAA